jgi:hypothetical protein
MRADDFKASPTGRLVPIAGNDPQYGPWEHVAFVAHPLPGKTPALEVETFNAVADVTSEWRSMRSRGTPRVDRWP